MLEVSLILKPRLLVSFTILESFQMNVSHVLDLPATMGKHKRSRVVSIIISLVNTPST